MPWGDIHEYIGAYTEDGALRTMQKIMVHVFVLCVYLCVVLCVVLCLVSVWSLESGVACCPLKPRCPQPTVHSPQAPPDSLFSFARQLDTRLTYSDFNAIGTRPPPPPPAWRPRRA